MGGKGCQGVAGGGRGEGEYCDADAMRNSCQGGVADYAAREGRCCSLQTITVARVV